MYCVQKDGDKKPNLPFWADQICSFNREHITKLLPNATVRAAMVSWSRQRLHHDDDRSAPLVQRERATRPTQIPSTVPLCRYAAALLQYSTSKTHEVVAALPNLRLNEWLYRTAASMHQGAKWNEEHVFMRVLERFLANAGGERGSGVTHCAPDAAAA